MGKLTIGYYCGIPSLRNCFGLSITENVICPWILYCREASIYNTYHFTAGK